MVGLPDVCVLHFALIPSSKRSAVYENMLAPLHGQPKVIALLTPLRFLHSGSAVLSTVFSVKCYSSNDAWRCSTLPLQELQNLSSNSSVSLQAATAISEVAAFVYFVPSLQSST